MYINVHRITNPHTTCTLTYACMYTHTDKHTHTHTHVHLTHMYIHNIHTDTQQKNSKHVSTINFEIYSKAFVIKSYWIIIELSLSQHIAS